MNTTLINGKTGDIILNRKGDRINAVYQIVNLGKKTDTQLTVVGEYRDGNVTISKTVFWPGGQDEKPEGIFVSTNLRVGFIYGFNRKASTTVVIFSRHTCTTNYKTGVEILSNFLYFFVVGGDLGGRALCFHQVFSCQWKV